MAPDASQPDPSRPILIVHHPSGEESRTALERETITLGRRGTNDVQIPEPTVSREHARLVREDGGYVIEDLNSTHGTFVNDESADRRPLGHGDRIRLGRAFDYTLRYQTGSEITQILETTLGPDTTASTRPEDPGNLSALLEISKALNSSLRLDEVLDKVMDAVLGLTRAERGMLLLGNEVDDLRVQAQRNFGSGDPGGGDYSHSVVEEVFSTRQPKILVDTSEDPRFSEQQSIVDLELRTVMCVPLPLSRLTAGSAGEATPARGRSAIETADGAAGDAAPGGGAPAGEAGGEVERRILGVVYVDRRSPTRRFTEQDLALFESLAGHAAIAIENARLYEEALEKRRLEQDLEVAYRIQQSLLPSRFPELACAEVHGVNVPTRGVGGDYFDVLETDSGALSFAVGDVSGKGVPAALLMATLQSSFLTSFKTDQNLGEVCRHVNQFLHERTQQERYATFFVGHLSASRHLSYVNAGHNPQILLRGDDSEHLAGGGLPLGLFPGREYEVQERELQPGDLIVCFTDGVTEANSPDGEEFQEERLLETILEHRDDSAEEITDAVLSAVRAHARGGAGLFDDITLVVVRVK